MLYALIQNGFVVNLISTDDANFAEILAKDYDAAVRVDNSPSQPAVGSMYSGGSFYPPTSDLILSEAKRKKIDQIDERTSTLIMQGFTYNNKHFSMSDAAQRNWVGLAAAKANGLIQFPLVVSTVDEDHYTLTSATDCMMFLVAFLTYQADPNQPLGLGRNLKAQITAASSVDEVNGIVDPR